MKKVAILVPLSRAFERGLVAGIIRYAHAVHDWLLYTKLPDYANESVENSIDNLMTKWQPDGAIGRFPYLGVDYRPDLGIPLVSTHIYGPGRQDYSIIPDCQTPAKIVAEYFLKKGYTSFAFCGFNMHWCLARAHFFRSCLKEYGIASIEEYQTPKDKMKSTWETEQNDLVKWLVGLKKPVAMFTANDDRGSHVLEACKLANIKVPEEIAVIGSDNDTLVCGISEPPLSSISYNFERAGFEAAKMLDSLIEGRIPQKNHILIRPISVITRHSSDMMAIEDADLARALNFIGKNRNKDLQVGDVVSATNLSRRTLEIKFKKYLGRTILDEIRTERIEHVAHLLATSNMTVSQISFLTGFSDSKRLYEVFKQLKGLAPSEYRKKFGIHA